MRALTIVSVLDLAFSAGFVANRAFGVGRAHAAPRGATGAVKPALALPVADQNEIQTQAWARADGEAHAYGLILRRAACYITLSVHPEHVVAQVWEGQNTHLAGGTPIATYRFAQTDHGWRVLDGGIDPSYQRSWGTRSKYS